MNRNDAKQRTGASATKQGTIFPIVSTGFFLPVGGSGTFTTMIIPQPSSLTLFALGALGVVACLRLRANGSS
jgi:hypothetical protein